MLYEFIIRTLDFFLYLSCFIDFPLGLYQKLLTATLIRKAF